MADGGTERRRRDPSSLSPRDAVERYLRRRRSDATDASIHTWRYRLKLFVEWCEVVGIETVGELDGLVLDEFHEHRAGQTRPTTLRNEMTTLKSFLEFCEQLGAVDDLQDRVRIPDVDEAAMIDETMLDPADAIPLLRGLREHDRWFGTRLHTLLELAWLTGARMGGLRALDLRDYFPADAYVAFQHRPESGTPLKNKFRGERAVALPQVTVDAVDRYVDEYRHDVRDEHGRQPLLTSQLGRPAKGTIRTWMYLATEPCLVEPCPHGKVRESCAWTAGAQASLCPSSRSPHQVRSGSITWQLNRRVPPEVVGERVNATMDVIERHYDQESPVGRMERRREHVERLDLNDDSDTNHDAGE